MKVTIDMENLENIVESALNKNVEQAVKEAAKEEVRNKVNEVLKEKIEEIVNSSIESYINEYIKTAKVQVGDSWKGEEIKEYTVEQYLKLKIIDIFDNKSFEIKKKDIIICKELGVETVVFGILNKNNTIDIDRTRELVDLAQGLKVTFHMAFDEIYDKFKALEQLISIGVDRVLTKGGKDCAEEGKVVL